MCVGCASGPWRDHRAREQQHCHQRTDQHCCGAHDRKGKGSKKYKDSPQLHARRLARIRRWPNCHVHADWCCVKSAHSIGVELARSETKRHAIRVQCSHSFTVWDWEKPSAIAANGKVAAARNRWRSATTALRCGEQRGLGTHGVLRWPSRGWRVARAAVVEMRENVEQRKWR